MVLDISQKVPSIATSGGGLGILTLIQVFDGPERYGTFSFFETIPLKVWPMPDFTIVFLIGLGIGFGAGYGIREYMSRKRHRRAREQAGY
jgi:hypothetical protein